MLELVLCRHGVLEASESDAWFLPEQEGSNGGKAAYQELVYA